MRFCCEVSIVKKTYLKINFLEKSSHINEKRTIVNIVISKFMYKPSLGIVLPKYNYQSCVEYANHAHNGGYQMKVDSGN